MHDYFFDWAVLSDEQMGNGYPFSLLNDEQMSNNLGVVRTNQLSFRGQVIYLSADFKWLQDLHPQKFHRWSLKMM